MAKQYGKLSFKDIERRKKLRVAKIMLEDPYKELSKREQTIGNQILEQLKKDGRTLANYVKLEGKPPPSPSAPKRKPARPGIAARSAARVEAQRDIDEDVSGRARPVPIIKSPAGPSKRRPTRVEKEDERKKREAARRRQGMQTTPTSKRKLTRQVKGDAKAAVKVEPPKADQPTPTRSGLRGETVSIKKPRRVLFGQKDISDRQKRKAAGKKAITQSDRAVNKLRIAKAFLNKKDLTQSDEKILGTLLNSLDKKYGKKEGYQNINATLRDWVNNKKGMRNKALVKGGIGDEALRFPEASIKSSRIQDARAAQRAEAQHKQDVAAFIEDKNKQADLWQQKRGLTPAPKPREIDKTVDKVIAFGPRTVSKTVSKPREIDKTVDKVIAFGPSTAVTDKKKAPAKIGDKKITIRSGDTLSALAKKGKTTLGAIRKANPGRFPTAKSLNIIRTGEKINMPPAVGATTPYDVKTVRKTTTPPDPKRKPARVTGIAAALPKKKRHDPDIAVDKGISFGPSTAATDKKKAKAGLMPWNWKQLTGPEDQSPGKRIYETLFGDLEVDSSMNTDYSGDDYKKGGRIKKSVKKAKAKPRKAKAKTRKRAALRGHRAELRGG